MLYELLEKKFFLCLHRGGSYRSQDISNAPTGQILRYLGSEGISHLFLVQYRITTKDDIMTPKEVVKFDFAIWWTLFDSMEEVDEFVTYLTSTATE